jgi:septum formation protein
MLPLHRTTEWMFRTTSTSFLRRVKTSSAVTFAPSNEHDTKGAAQGHSRLVHGKWSVEMIDESHPLLLGSASPRRREILTTLGLPLRVASVDVDERMLEAESADDYLVRITSDKLVQAARHAEGCGAVLVADTSVILDGRVLGKPTGHEDARAMIRDLSSRDHEVWTRFAVSSGEAPTHVLHAQTVRTRVTFRALDDVEIAAYVATGEGRDKAGAYAIQGIGGFAVSRIDGSYSNVVGLPACEVIVALQHVGLLGPFPRTQTS